MNRLVLVIVALVIVTALYWATSKRRKTVTVYGTHTCSWCIKQKDYLNRTGTPFTFIDCSSGSCPDFVSGYPTVVCGSRVTSGYTEDLT
jgi:hypothetical protein